MRNKQPPNCPEWELAICRVAPPIGLLTMTTAISFGVDINPFVVLIVAGANWNQAIATMGLPAGWIVRIPTKLPSIPGLNRPTKQIEDKAA
jgi:hypothetical protein